MHSILMKAVGLTVIILATTPAFAVDTAEIERGRYLATAGDCIACHTAPKGKSMAGGLALASPMGAIYSTNITPSKTHGIGNYTLEQFSDALRHGKRADGANLYPAMPYTAYAKTSDEDISAMYTYFMHGVEAVDVAPQLQTNLPFPFNVRMTLGVWNAMFHDATPYKVDTTQTPEWNRGAYLSQGLTHCTTCHTPRTALMSEDKKRSLGGGTVGGWDAPNITSDSKSGIGGWSEDDLIKYMSGQPVPGKGMASGPMAEAIDHSLKYLSPEDLKAIAVYIKSVPAVATGAQQSADSFGSKTDALDTIRGIELPANYDAMIGAQLYDAYCSTCHQAQAQGTDDGSLPSLFNNTSLGHKGTNNLVQVMLHGVERHGVDTVMPGFGHELTDKQIATLGNFLLTSYGNPEAKVTEAQVAMLRDPATAGTDNTLVTLARIGMAVGCLIALSVAVWLVRRRKR